MAAIGLLGVEKFYHRSGADRRERTERNARLRQISVVIAVSSQLDIV
jgi:hypothetical protein